MSVYCIILLAIIMSDNLCYLTAAATRKDIQLINVPSIDSSL